MDNRTVNAHVEVILAALQSKINDGCERMENRESRLQREIVEVLRDARNALYAATFDQYRERLRNAPHRAQHPESDDLLAHQGAQAATYDLQAMLHRLDPKEPAELRLSEGAPRVETVRVPVKPSRGLLTSMAFRYDHSFGLERNPDAGPIMSRVGHDAASRASILTTMKQLHEEVVGTGFYRPDKEADYARCATEGGLP